jgi:hypothetical protein
VLRYPHQALVVEQHPARELAAEVVGLAVGGVVQVVTEGGVGVGIALGVEAGPQAQAALRKLFGQKPPAIETCRNWSGILKSIAVPRPRKTARL